MADQKLADRNCTSEAAALEDGAARSMLQDLNEWEITGDGEAIERRFTFKGFLKAVEMANLAAWLGNKQDHHPDIRFGFGYCEVRFTTHDAGGLSENDFICAAKLDALVA
ncbi:4a-hydroxytetrahydrobiopterin dehydratase [Paracoccus isoporae]|uniref:Putative pterin-4-alpha-carbinolamine dehydratase n=1 Tax=Paracoccus isoporae TaxID=591205 RepID=A0A1G7CUR2_9RHOB|nr:4a-hydroxytetrahydrobiopterin dehydratase [Paracoccus isoporae]SDE42963.1 4a-hydroxytetrahydrobiopterin dehydratase [Paracoccus isoporae]